MFFSVRIEAFIKILFIFWQSLFAIWSVSSGTGTAGMFTFSRRCLSFLLKQFFTILVTTNLWGSWNRLHNGNQSKEKPMLRNSFNGSFHGSRHCSAVYHIDRMVGAMVNSAEANIRFAVKSFINKFYTICRCAGGLPGFHITKNIHAVHAKWRADRDRMPYTALRLVRATTTTFEVFNCFYQVAYAGWSDVVVIRYQYNGFSFFLPSCFLKLSVLLVEPPEKGLAISERKGHGITTKISNNANPKKMSIFMLCWIRSSTLNSWSSDMYQYPGNDHHKSMLNGKNLVAESFIAARICFNLGWTSYLKIQYQSSNNWRSQKIMNSRLLCCRRKKWRLPITPVRAFNTVQAPKEQDSPSQNCV